MEVASLELRGDRALLMRLCTIVLNNAIESSEVSALLKRHCYRAGDALGSRVCQMHQGHIQIRQSGPAGTVVGISLPLAVSF